MAEGRPKRSAERKGKAGPLETGGGKHSPPASPERVTSEALKRRNSGVSPEELRKLVYLCLTGKPVMDDPLSRRNEINGNRLTELINTAYRSAMNP